MTKDRNTKTFLVEIYRHGLSDATVREWASQLRRQVDPGDLTCVRLVHTALVEADGCLLCEIAGPSAEAVEAACSQAGMRPDRISPAITHDEGRSTASTKGSAMKRSTRITAAASAIAAAAAVTVAVSVSTASADDNNQITVAEVVQLHGNLQASQTEGSFTAGGSASDKGTENGDGKFEGNGASPTGPNVLDASQLWTGTHGTISVSLHGEFGPLPANTAAGHGTWWITGGTGDYTNLHGRGTWNAVADFTAPNAGYHQPPTVSFMFTGKTH